MRELRFKFFSKMHKFHRWLAGWHAEKAVKAMRNRTP